jgi:hypothetical protein
MVDYTTYNMLHSTWADDDRDFIKLDPKDRGEPPQDDLIYLFPLKAVGYNIRLKKWGKWHRD